MRLGNLLVHLLVDWGVGLKRGPCKLALHSGNLPQEMFDLLQNFGKADIAHYRKDYLGGVQAAGNKVEEILLRKTGDGLLRTQNISAQGMVLKNGGIKFILKRIIRGIAVHRHFLSNYLSIPFDLFGREHAVKGDSAPQFR